MECLALHQERCETHHAAIPPSRWPDGWSDHVGRSGRPSAPNGISEWRAPMASTSTEPSRAHPVSPLTSAEANGFRTTVATPHGDRVTAAGDRRPATNRGDRNSGTMYTLPRSPIPMAARRAVTAGISTSPLVSAKPTTRRHSRLRLKRRGHAVERAAGASAVARNERVTTHQATFRKPDESGPPPRAEFGRIDAGERLRTSLIALASGARERQAAVRRQRR